MRRYLTSLVAGQIFQLQLDDLNLVLQVNDQLTELLWIHIQLIDLVTLVRQAGHRGTVVGHRPIDIL